MSKNRVLDPKRTAVLLGAETSMSVKVLVRKLAKIADDKKLPITVRLAARGELKKFACIP